MMQNTQMGRFFNFNESRLDHLHSPFSESLDEAMVGIAKSNFVDVKRDKDRRRLGSGVLGDGFDVKIGGERGMDGKGRGERVIFGAVPASVEVDELIVQVGAQ